MKKLRNTDLRDMLRHRGGPCVSLYLPLPLKGEQLKELLTQAGSQLQSTYPYEACLGFLAPLDALAGRISETLPFPFRGTACLFQSKDFFGYFIAPDASGPLAFVGESFHLKPLIGVLQSKREFGVLCIHQGQAEVLKCDENGYEVIHQTRYPSDRALHDLDCYIQRCFADRKIPVVLCCDDDTYREYLRLSAYPRLIRARVAETHRDGGAVFVYLKAKRLVQLKLRNEEDLAFLELVRHIAERRVTTELDGIVRAISSDEIQSLYLAKDACLWGTVDWDRARCEIHPVKTPTPSLGPTAPTSDILNVLAMRATSARVRVWLVPGHWLPKGVRAVAVFKPPLSAGKKPLYPMSMP